MRGGGGVREERAPPPTTIKGGEREGGEKESGVAAEAVQLASSASASASASASPVKSDRVSDGGREALSPVCEEVESEKEKKRPPPPIRQTSIFPAHSGEKRGGAE